MNTLALLVAGALVPQTIADALLADLPLPNFAQLAARGRAQPAPAMPDAPLLAPGEAWLLGFEPHANLAALWAALDGVVGLASETAVWMLEPVQFRIGHNHAVLADPRELDLDLLEAEQLAAAARPILAEAGWTLHCPAPQRWYLTRNAPLTLMAPSLSCALGQNVAPWMPRGDPGAARAWRATMNEIQMTWFAHPVNRRRDDEDRPAVNGLWLSGTGTRAPAVPRYARIASSQPLWSRLPVYPEALATLETSELLVPHASVEDWGAWRGVLADLDARLGLLLADLSAGRLAALDIVLCGTGACQPWRLERRDLWKFWRRGTVPALFAAPEAAREREAERS